MSMNADNDALKSKLKQLHAALESAESPDGELTQLLRMLDGDIQALLARQAHSAVESADVAVDVTADVANLSARTQSISARFAVQHPRLEPVLRELTDMLARIGI